MIWSIFLRNSLMVQWLGLHALTAKGTGSIPGQGPKIPQAMRSNQKVVFFYFVPCLNFTRNGFYWLCFSVYGPYFLVHVSIFCWKMNILIHVINSVLNFRIIEYVLFCVLWFVYLTQKILNIFYKKSFWQLHNHIYVCM